MICCSDAAAGPRVAPLVERASRYLILVHLPDGPGTDSVVAALTAARRGMPPERWRSLTWDRGREMARLLILTSATNVPVFFCNARSPWQQGSSENTNGLLRPYLPKGADLSAHTPEELKVIADELNSRPRKVLGWHSRTEVWTAEVAMIA